jgi:phosphoribosylaminoimidazole-succinocarboxamide synthase
MVLAVFESSIPSLPLAFRGKVRDVYDLGDDLLIVTTDRLSAFDVVLPTPIPGKGRVLTALSRFWFGKTADLVANHMTSRRLADILPAAEAAALEDRSMIVRKAAALPVEAVVRGYLVGSGWAEYQRSGTVCGIPLPAGLPQAAKLPQPIFTPSTKAPQGEHDENVSFERAAELLGGDVAARVRDLSLEIYGFGARRGEERGIIIADTKFEFGMLDGEIILIDELLTPDSSRFWPKSEYRTGISPPSFDKQFVRDWLSNSGWNKEPPAPQLPEDVVARTSAKYQQALDLLT